MKTPKSRPIVFAIIAFLAGLVYLLLYILIDLYASPTTGSLNQIISSQLKTPVSWMVYMLPVILSLVAYPLGHVFEMKINELEKEKKHGEARLQNIRSFIRSLIENSKEDILSEEFRNDPVAEMLISLKEEIEKSKAEEAKRRSEEDQRNWMTEGLARFAEILRNNHDDINELSYQLVSNLVKYTSSNQGALYVLNDDAEYNKYFEMTACYAYDRRKFTDQRIEFGEGLLGTCALEKQTIHLTEIPDGYLNITSGLGQSNPRSLLIVPLNINDQNFGVLEIASFYDYQNHQIEFIEKVAEGVASTISGVKISMKTAKLLKESREQAEIMASQEEEMRQNMEELQATQEEAARQNERYVRFSGTVDKSLLIAELDLNGNFLSANQNFLRKAGYPDFKYLRGQHYMTLIDANEKNRFDVIWSNLISKKEGFEGVIPCTTRSGRDFWLTGALTPVLNNDQKILHVLFMAFDQSETRKKLSDCEEQLSLTDRAFPQARLDPDGTILGVNEQFTSILKANREDFMKKPVFDLLLPGERDKFRTKWKTVSQGSFFTTHMTMVSSDGTHRKFVFYFIGLKDLNSEIGEIVMLANPDSGYSEIS